MTKRTSRTIKYDPGEFIMTTFSPVGSKVGKHPFHTYEQAMVFGKHLGHGVTFVISRILFNSSKPHRDIMP